MFDPPMTASSPHGQPIGRPKELQASCALGAGCDAMLTRPAMDAPRFLAAPHTSCDSESKPAVDWDGCSAALYRRCQLAAGATAMGPSGASWLSRTWAGSSIGMRTCLMQTKQNSRPHSTAMGPRSSF